MISPQEYNPYYQSYIDLSLKGPIVENLESNMKRVMAFYKSIPREKLDYAYAHGKWTPKDIILHLTDAERVFAYRALRVARADATELSGFEQDDYVVSAMAGQRSLESLLNEYKAVRSASIELFRSFPQETLALRGLASGSVISVRAIGYILTGHENHHVKVIGERYL